MPPDRVRQALVALFRHWGQPGALRVDNGEPLGSPTRLTTSALALWLIGQGVEMIFNKPYRPQSNAKVERLQDTSARWAEAAAATGLEQLQQALDRQARFHREGFPVTRLGGKTRLEVFPELQVPVRAFDPQGFRAERVYRFLARKVYTRSVSKVGQMAHFGRRVSVGWAYKHQYVHLRLDPAGPAWQVFASDELIKTYPATELSEECLVNLTVYLKVQKDET